MIIANSTARRVGITGSFGKSSTKTILGHLLTMKHGPDQVLVSPKNENTEVALARLIVDQSDFFNTGENKIFLAEMGAYARGEIEDVCVFVQPHIGVMTGINDQHIALFGSKEKQLAAKGELPKACTEKIFFPAEDPELTHWFDVQTLKAEVFPVSQLGIQIEISDHEKTVFVYRNQRFTLPWCGKFFVRNALLAIETAESLGVSLAESAIFLTTLPPLERALHMKKHASGALILEDLYSANPDGVLAAIDELGKVPGHKIFVGLPLRELGAKAESIHQQIFQRLAEVGAEVFWLKPDFEDIGKKLCGTQFHQDDQVLLAHMIEALSEQDGILLESRLPQDILDLFYV